ncbi:MAG: hypothetical protein AAFY01_08255 [Pseudomonadota bacterium]
MTDTPDQTSTAVTPAPDMVAAVEAPLADVEPIDDENGNGHGASGSDVEWYEDGGRKTALGAWAGVAVLSYATMQVTGYFADWPFVALVAGAVGYFAVRGVAVVLAELKRRTNPA